MNKFRNSSNVRYLKALFYETVNEDKSTVVYTLKDIDHCGFPSLYRLYMEENDPTEYRFAVRYLDGHEHWEMLTGCTWFKDYIARWRRELELRLRSQALDAIMKKSLQGDKEGYLASKYLLDGGWQPRNTKGRPTREQIKNEATKIANTEAKLIEDYNRITSSGSVN